MKLYDISQYNKAKEKVRELEPILKDLDKVVDIIYNNIGNPGMFRLLEHAEDIRVEYYLRHHECMQVIRNKGKIINE